MARFEPPAASRGMEREDAAQTVARVRYDRVARWYDLVVSPLERHARTIALHLLAPAAGERVLEIGSGTGIALREIAVGVGPAGRATGIDVSPRMSERAAARLAEAGADGWARVMVVAAPPLPFADASFDAVFLCFTLEAVRPEEARAALLRDCRRVLARSGRIVCAAISARRCGSLAARGLLALHRHLGSSSDGAPIHASELVAAAGFTVRVRLGLRVWGLPVDVVEGRP
jgi:ubiquinone/menaquinone biosynthesis C-methylase UbiE